MNGFGTKRPWLVKGTIRKDGWYGPVEVRYSTADAARHAKQSMESQGYQDVRIIYKPVR